MKRGLGACVGIFSAVAIGASARPASADEAGDIAAARQLGVEGVVLADQGRCAEAIDKLDRSEKLHHAVSVLERLAECQVSLGKLVAGSENLRRVLRESLLPDAPAPFLVAQERAQRVLAETRPKIARLKVVVSAPADADLWVTIDGSPIPAANLNENRPIDPGDHAVKVGAPGFAEAGATVHLTEGGTESIALSLVREPNAAKEPSASAVAARGAAEHPLGRSHVASYVAGGLGVVGLGIGVGFGIAAMGEKSNLERYCVNKVCAPSAQGVINSGTRFGDISTVAFIAGGVGLVAGAVLYFVDFGGGGSRSRAARAYVGPGSAGIVGVF
jgi:hypothetical protein